MLRLAGNSTNRTKCGERLMGLDCGSPIWSATRTPKPTRATAIRGCTLRKLETSPATGQFSSLWQLSEVEREFLLDSGLQAIRVAPVINGSRRDILILLPWDSVCLRTQ